MKGADSMRLKDTLLIAGKDPAARALIRRIFSDTYNIIEAAEKEQALFLFEQNTDCIAAAILDVVPAKTREDSLILKMRQIKGSNNVPIILLCEKDNDGYEITGYEYGASDVILKPLNETILFHRVQSLVELAVHKNHLEVLVEEQADVLRSSNETMVDVLSTIIEYRSIETGNHVMRIRQYTRVLLEKIAESYPEYGLTPDDIASITSAASLHDIGKISIPDSILNKPGRLTDEEFEIMKNHTTNGAQILQNLHEVGDRKYLRYAYNICLYHHERWDGCGYPKGLVGDEIPICAQVAGIADVYDALTSNRVYKDAYSHTRAINMILNGECGAFSHKVLDSLKKVRDEFQQIMQNLSDGTAEDAEDITAPLPAPSYPLEKVNALQIVQAKYQTLLHHADAAVVEADLHTGVYHIVFNPNPDFYLSGHKDSLEDALQDMMDTVVHAGDRKDGKRLTDSFREALIQRGQRKCTFAFRMYTPSAGEYVPYRATVMHIKDNNPDSAFIMIIFEPDRKDGITGEEPDLSAGSSGFWDRRFDNLAISNIVCENCSRFTICSGTESLFSLTGYTPEEIDERFQNSLRQMILPEDRNYIQEQIDDQLKRGKILDLEYRIMHKQGHSIWILDKSRLFEGKDGKEYFYSTLIDNSKAHRTQELLQEELDRNKLIINQSNDIVFELDIETNKLWCSDKWEERFGHKFLSDDYTERVFKYSHIHPDDMPKMQTAIKKLVQGESHVRIDVRIVNADGVYTWNQIRATSRPDETGRITKAIGVIVDVDQEIQSMEDLQRKSERDTLTGLYNKVAAQNKINRLLSEAEDTTCSALLIMDLDNFKSVNDTYGHLFGDNILMKTAAAVQKFFRSDDIIGRIGGDEFAIYMNGITDPSVIRSRCEMLVENLEHMFRQLLPDIQVSCSIGAALMPDHGTNYVELFQKADQALYQAKRNGKNGYTIYDTGISAAAIGLASSINEKIDSNEQPGIANNSLLYYLFQRLYESADKYAAIQSILSEVGQRLNVSRVYIFESNDARTEVSNTFEWCNEGITPEIDNLQNLNYIDGDIAGYDEIFNERGILYCTDINTLEDRFRVILEPQGVKSLLQCAIYDKNEFLGFVGFDECVLDRIWTQEQIDLLVLLARTTVLFLLRERDRVKTEISGENLKNVLDKQDAWIYVIEPDTHVLKYVNRRARDLSPDITENAYCYEAFMKQDAICQQCPARILGERKNTEAVIENKYFNMKIRCRAAEIKWNGEKAILITCHKTED